MQYLSPVTAAVRFSMSTKLTGNISDKLTSIYMEYIEEHSCHKNVVKYHSFHFFSTIVVRVNAA